MFPKLSLIKQSNQFDMDQCTVVGLLADVVYASSHLLLFKTWVHISVLNYNMLCHGCYYRNDHNTKLRHLYSGVTAGGGEGREQSAPLTLLTGIFCWPTGKREARENRENGEGKKENRKREGGKLKMEGEKLQNGGEDPFFLLLFFFWHDMSSRFCKSSYSRPELATAMLVSFCMAGYRKTQQNVSLVFI